VLADRASIQVLGGRGGNGCVSFRREKYVPKGGPDGGDGGDGGSVIVKVNTQLRTLLDFQSRTLFRADSGAHGSGNQRSGRSGEDLIVEVPLGTLVIDEDSGALLADLVEAGGSLVAARGGRGGRGNARFATSTNRAPRTADPGRDGEARRLKLELRLIADVGLVGFPNVGKSTLLARLSAARPKIADYPFTTLEPLLGLVRVRDEHSFVMADLPGLLEGAHLGKGLGHEFLRHIHRTRVLLILIDSLSPDPVHDLTVLRHELREHDEALARRPSIVAMSRHDLVPDRTIDSTTLRLEEARWGGAISGVTGEGLPELLDRLWAMLSAEVPLDLPESRWNGDSSPAPRSDA